MSTRLSHLTRTHRLNHRGLRRSLLLATLGAGLMSGGPQNAEAAPKLSRLTTGEAALLRHVNVTANRMRRAGSPVAGDPAGVRDSDSVATVKYRLLRNVYGWPADRLALALVANGADKRMVVLVSAGSTWIVLDHRSTELVTLERRRGEGWRIQPLTLVPASGGLGAWTISAREESKEGAYTLAPGPETAARGLSD